MKKSFLSFLISVLFLLLIVSCKPSKSFIRTNDDFQSRILNSPKIGIVSDVCLEWNPLFKKDYVILDESKSASTYMAEEAKLLLESKGYSVNYTFNPFVGSFLSVQDSVRIADSKGKPVLKATAPYYADELLITDTIYADAIYEVLNAFYYTMTNNVEPPFSSDPYLINSLKMISEYSGQDLMLLLLGNGNVVPVGKTILKGVTIGLLTALVSFGYFTYYIYDGSSFDSYVGLLDLKTGDLLWTNFMNISGDLPDRRAFYSNYWAENLLYYFPSKIVAPEK